MQFHIAKAELIQRRRRIQYGLVFSTLLAALIGYQHQQAPQDYNDVLFWSVMGFLLAANLINYFRHRRYLAKARIHHIELLDEQIAFVTGEESSRLPLADIAAMRSFHRREKLAHIQLKLRNGRGIRLEGYEQMDQLEEALQQRLPGRQF
jgi:hypothetical protein